MKNKINKFLLSSLLALLLVLVLPKDASAVVQTLNGQTGQTQTFQNGTNVTLSSASNIHSLGWQGLLSMSRGGTGASTFSTGSVLFSNGTSFSQDNSNFFWDNINKRLGIGTNTPTSALDTPGSIRALDFTAYDGGITLFDGAAIEFYNGSDPEHQVENGSLAAPLPGVYYFVLPNVAFGSLDFSHLTEPNKNYVFPNSSGTISLLENDQTWTGVNNFEASSKSTIFIGSSTKTGCIALGDSDSDGITYITANDGVLGASATKPSFCQ